MTYISPKDLIPRFFYDTAKTYDRVASWATFGKDNYWKNQIVNKIKKPSSVLDIACGTGLLTRKIAEKNPNANVIGVDISLNYLIMAKQNSKSFSNVSFIHMDAEKLNLDQKFDCICSSYIPKYCTPNTLAKKLIEHLNPNGEIILHDFTYPHNSIIKNLWNFYFVLLQFVGFFIPPWKYAFFQLPKLIKKSNWVMLYRQAFETYGFTITQYDLTWNSSTILYVKQENT